MITVLPTSWKACRHEHGAYCVAVAHLLLVLMQRVERYQLNALSGAYVGDGNLNTKFG